MRRGLQWVTKRRLAFGRGPAGWIASITLGLLTIAILIGAFLAWRVAQAPISLGFAIPRIEEALSSADGTMAVKLGGFRLRREGFAFVFEAEEMAVYRVDPATGQSDAELATLPVAQIGLSVPALVQHGVLAPNRIVANDLQVTAERGREGIELSFVDNADGSGGSIRLSALQQLLRDDPRLRYLQSMEMDGLTFRLVDPLLGISWETQGAEMRLLNNEAGFRWNGQIGLASHQGGDSGIVEEGGSVRWNLTIPPYARAAGAETLLPAEALLTVTLERLEPSLVLELLPTLAEVVEWNGAVSGTLSAAFAPQSLPENVEYDLTVGGGLLTLPGLDRHLGFDSASAAGQLRLGDRSLEVDEFVISHAGNFARLRGFGALHGADQARVQVAASGLNLAWLSTIVPGAETLGGADIGVFADIDAMVRRGGGVDHAAIFLRTDPGQLALPGVLPEPLAVGTSTMSLQVANQGRDIHLQRLDISLPRSADQAALPISITGSASKGGEGRLNIVAGELDIADLKRLWPIGVGEGARVWIVDQVHAGLVPEVEGEIRFRLPDATGFAEPQDVRVEARMPLRDVALTYWPPMPDATGLDADARITEKLFEATVLRGSSAGMQVNGGELQFTGIDKGKGHERTAMSFDISGQASRLMTVLDRQPLGFARFLGLPPDQLGGTISGTLKAAFPPVQELSLDDIEIEAEGITGDLVLPNAAFNQDLRKGRIRFKVDKSALNLQGDAEMAGTPVALTGDLNYSPRPPFRSRFQLKGTLGDRARQQLGFAEFPFSPDVVSGPVKVEMTATEPVSGATVIDVAADLSGALMRLPLLDWESPAGEYAALNARVRIDNGRLRKVDSFRVTAPQLSIAGDVEWRDAPGLAPDVRISELRHGANTNVTVVGAPSAEGGYRISIAGAALDARPIMEELTDSGASGGNQAEAGRLAIDMDVAAVQIGSGQLLEAMRGEAVLENGSVRTASLGATSAGGGQISAEVQPGGAAALNASDAGALLEALGITDRVQGGRLQINARLQQSDASITGTALMFGGVFEEAPFLVRLFSGGTINRPALARSWSVDRFDTEFELENGILMLEDGRVSGGELGATFQGWVDLNKNVLDISGAIVPAYSVNRVLRAIPLIGDVLTGGEGLFAANYRATGNASEPEFSVNPLTALAPGLLRRLFGDSASAPPTGN